MSDEKKISKLVDVVAIEPGHDGIVYRNNGERFQVPEERLTDGSTWFVAADKAPAPKAKTASDIPPGAGPLKGSKVGKQS